MNSGRFPLVSDGDGWWELLPHEIEPGRVYEAYREICTDETCPFAWPAEHSHIVEMPFTAAPTPGS